MSVDPSSSSGKKKSKKVQDVGEASTSNEVENAEGELVNKNKRHRKDKRAFVVDSKSQADHRKHGTRMISTSMSL
jgi:hypothetical protein